MFCNNCGKEIDDNAVVCPHCGVAVNMKSYNSQFQPQTDSNTIAIIGFVFSFLFALVGLICSIIGFNKAKNEGAPHRGLALAGIIISAVSIGLSILLYIIIIAAGVALL